MVHSTRSGAANQILCLFVRVMFQSSPLLLATALHNPDIQTHEKTTFLDKKLTDIRAAGLDEAVSARAIEPIKPPIARNCPRPPVRRNAQRR